MGRRIGVRLRAFEIPEQSDSASIASVDVILETLTWQAYEALNDPTLLVEPSVAVVLELKGTVYRSEASSLDGEVLVTGCGWNDHYDAAVALRNAILTFRVRVDQGVGEDYLQLDSAKSHGAA